MSRHIPAYHQHNRLADIICMLEPWTSVHQCVRIPGAACCAESWATVPMLPSKMSASLGSAVGKFRPHSDHDRTTLLWVWFGQNAGINMHPSLLHLSAHGTSSQLGMCRAHSLLFSGQCVQNNTVRMFLLCLVDSPQQCAGLHSTSWPSCTWPGLLQAVWPSGRSPQPRASCQPAQQLLPAPEPASVESGYATGTDHTTGCCKCGTIAKYKQTCTLVCTAVACFLSRFLSLPMVSFVCRSRSTPTRMTGMHFPALLKLYWTSNNGLCGRPVSSCCFRTASLGCSWVQRPEVCHTCFYPFSKRTV